MASLLNCLCSRLSLKSYIFIFRDTIVDVGRKVKNLKSMMLIDSSINLVLEAFSGGLSTLIELELINAKNLIFEKICNEFVSLKKLILRGDEFELSGNLISKLKQLEICVLDFDSKINMSSIRGWSSSNMKDLTLHNISGINLKVK